MPREPGVQGRPCLTDANPNREAGTAFSSKFKTWLPRSRSCATPGRHASEMRSSVAWAANRSCSKIPRATPSNSSNRHGNKPSSRSPHDQTDLRNFHQRLARPHLTLVVDNRIRGISPASSGGASYAEIRYALSIEEPSPWPQHSCESLAPAERSQLQLLGLFTSHLPPKGACVLARLLLVLCAGDGKGVSLRDQPVQGHLGGPFVVGLTDLAQDVYYRLDLLEVLLAEGFAHTPHEARGPVSTRSILAGKESFSNGAVGDERHAEIPARFEHPVGLRCPLQEAVLHLVRGERHPVRGEPLVRPLHLVRTVVADAHPADLACLDRLREGIHQTVYLENRAREVDLVEVYGFYPESLKTTVYCLQKRFGA